MKILPNSDVRMCKSLFEAIPFTPIKRGRFEIMSGDPLLEKAFVMSYISSHDYSELKAIQQAKGKVLVNGSMYAKLRGVGRFDGESFVL